MHQAELLAGSVRYLQSRPGKIELYDFADQATAKVIPRRTTARQDQPGRLFYERAHMNRISRVMASALTILFVAPSVPSYAQQALPSPAPSAAPTPGPGAVSVPFADPYPSTYVPFASRATLIRNATILTAAGSRAASASGS